MLATEQLREIEGKKFETMEMEETLNLKEIRYDYDNDSEFVWSGTNNTTGLGYVLKTNGISLDLTAEKGSGGLWLLDPTNIIISGLATTAGATPLPNYESNVDSSNVLNSDIVNQLNSGTSVTIQTGIGGAQAGDITLASDIVTGNMAGDATLT